MKFRIISFSVSFAILALLIYFSDVNEMVFYITRASLPLIFAGVAISFFMIFLRVERWNVLLKGLGIELKLKEIFNPFMAGMFISNITPAKSGDPVRSYFLKKKKDISFSRNLPSVVIERVFDIVVMIAISIIGLFFISAVVTEIGNILWYVVLIYAAGIAFVFYFGLNQKRLQNLLNKLYWILKFVPKFRKFQNKIEHVSSTFNVSFVKYKKSPAAVAKGFVLSFIVWFLESFVFYLAFASVGLEVNPLICFFILSIAVLIGVVSSLPGGLGSIEIVMVLLFSSIFSFPIAITTAAVLIGRFLGFWINLGVGALSLGFKI